VIREHRLAWLAAAVAVISCLVIPGGLLSSSWSGDVNYYAAIGSQVAHGQMPYHDFYLEYPPGSLPVFVLPSLVSQAHYFLVFKLLMAICVAVAAWVGVVLARGRVAAVVLLGVAPLLLGPLTLNRYDAWPAMLVAVALLALVRARPRIAFALLALAIVAKVYAIVLLPVFAIHLWRTRGSRELLRSLAILAAVGLVSLVPFAIFGFGGLGYSFYIQATRHLQIESLGAQVLIALDHLGLYHATRVLGRPGSVDLAGRLPEVVGVVTSLVEIAAIALVLRLQWRTPASARSVLNASAAAVTAFVVLGKVLSPQYLVWLPALVAAACSLPGYALLAAALVMTQISFHDSQGVAQLEGISWLVLARNAVLLALFALMVRTSRRQAA
jgi:hypothetical protein